MTTPSTDRAQRLYPNTARVLNRLIQSPATIKAISKDVHLSGEAVLDAIDNLRRFGVVYVSDWQRSSRGSPAKIWAAGKGEDAPRPEPKTRAERCKAWRDKGGDAKRSDKIRRQIKQIQRKSTMAGMLGL